MWNGAKRPPTLKPGQTTRAVSPPVGCQKPHPPSPFIIITQPESWYSFYHPTEGRRLSRPRHCSRVVLPVPKTVYRSGFYEKPATAHGGIRTLVLSHRSQACYLPAIITGRLTSSTKLTTIFMPLLPVHSQATGHPVHSMNVELMILLLQLLLLLLRLLGPPFPERQRLGIVVAVWLEWLVCSSVDAPRAWNRLPTVVELHSSGRKKLSERYFEFGSCNTVAR